MSESGFRFRVHGSLVAEFPGTNKVNLLDYGRIL